MSIPTPATGKTTTPSAVRRATPEDRDNVISALTAGFSDDVVIGGWMFPDPGTYTQYAIGYFACYTDFALEHGYVWTTGDATGALITMPSQAWLRTQHDTELKDRMIQLAGPYAERAFALDKAMAERHPTTPEHLYLALMGIPPQYRDRGTGTRMLQAAFELADSMQIPCYGESSCDRNGRLYDRLGLFRDKIPVVVPGGGPEVVPLWRPLPSSQSRQPEPKNPEPNMT